MHFMKGNCFGRAAVVAGVFAVSSALTFGAAQAQDATAKTYTMKITIATLNDQIHAYVKNLADAIDKNSGGRIKPEILSIASARFLT